MYVCMLWFRSVVAAACWLLSPADRPVEPIVPIH